MSWRKFERSWKRRRGGRVGRRLSRPSDSVSEHYEGSDATALRGDSKLPRSCAAFHRQRAARRRRGSRLAAVVIASMLSDAGSGTEATVAAGALAAASLPLPKLAP